MRTQSVLSLLAVAATTVMAEDAPTIEKNPTGAEYVAELKPKAPWDVSGSVKIATGDKGKGVAVKVEIHGLPSEGGPFMYHIHEKAVPENGNCTATGAHLDPYKRGEVPQCDAGNKKNCQTGDLSGKYGNMTGPDWTAFYTDDWLATFSEDPSFFGDKSVVVHLSNKTRIGCANFKLQSEPVTVSGYATASPSPSKSACKAKPSASMPGGGSNGTAPAPPTGTPENPENPTPPTNGAPIPPTATPSTPIESEGGAQTLMISGGAAFLAVAAAMFL